MSTTATNDELFSEDPQVSKLLSDIAAMSQPELLKSILEHEKQLRGIDWVELASDPSLSHDQVKEKAREKSKHYLKNLQAELGLSDEDLPDFTKQFFSNPNSDVQIMPAWGIDHTEAKEWKSATGDTLERMITYRLAIMQSLELHSSDVTYAQVMLSIGVISWMKKAYDFYKLARLAGLTRLAAIVKGIRGVTLQATKMFVATVVVAVIAEIILYLMEKEAVVYMVLVNMTDDDLYKDQQHLTHGKQMVQFIKPSAEAVVEPMLVKREVLDLGEGQIEAGYWTGLFVAQKKDMALYGSQGAFHFRSTPSLPSGAYVGWEIPLTNTFFSGGPNRCLVSLNDEGNCERFGEVTHARGNLNNSDSRNGITITGKMHSGDGSKGYMSVIIEKA